MFEELLERSVQRTKPWWHQRFPVAVYSITTCGQILDYLYDEEVRDYKDWPFEKMDPFTPDYDHELTNALLGSSEFRDLRVRFLARLTSYVVTICNLDGILRTSYRMFLDDLAAFGYQQLVPSDQGKGFLTERNAEIAVYTKFRHKVFAHTSFEQPTHRRGTDSASMQYSSIFFLSGVPGFIRPNCLATGGMSTLVDVHEVIPRISIVEGHPGVVQHYASWEAMYTEILRQIPPEELEKKANALEG